MELIIFVLFWGDIERHKVRQRQKHRDGIDWDDRKGNFSGVLFPSFLSGIAHLIVLASGVYAPSLKSDNNNQHALSSKLVLFREKAGRGSSLLGLISAGKACYF